MKKILLVYAPFCTPASPPYSISYLYSFLKNNCKEKIEAIDLNLEFHKLKFPEYQKYYKEMKWSDYREKTISFLATTKRVYGENNKKIAEGGKPIFFEELLKKIHERKPDVVAFSLVYSSQAFYVYALIKALKGITTVIGGPAVHAKLKQAASHAFNNDVEFLNFFSKTEHEKLKLDHHVEFPYPLEEYFTPRPVLPIKTVSTCYYQKCTFCTHFSKVPYTEQPLEVIKQTIVHSGQKYFFIIDDTIPKKRLQRLAAIFKSLGIHWACQLRPTRDFDLKTLKELKESGLEMIMWGLESGCQRVLNLMDKGTNIQDVARILERSHAAGIKNITYVMFGFPTETKEEFLETINFIKTHEKNIDLLSLSSFGLQSGALIQVNPSAFGIHKIIEEKRKVLEPKLSYEVVEGLSAEDASRLKKRFKKTFDKINKYPNTMNFFREHMLCLLGEAGDLKK